MNRQAAIDQIKQSSPQLSVGILTADMMNIAPEIQLLEKAGVKLLHIDVMDGTIWPKITVGAGFLGGLKTKMLKDVHLLIDKPEKHIESFAKAGADMITVHAETEKHLHRSLQFIRSLGVKAGVSVNPHTPVDFL